MSLVGKIFSSLFSSKPTSESAIDPYDKVTRIHEDLGAWILPTQVHRVHNQADYLQRNSLTALKVAPIRLALQNMVYRESRGLTHEQALLHSEYAARNSAIQAYYETVFPKYAVAFHAQQIDPYS
jgi:hypothetical protein